MRIDRSAVSDLIVRVAKEEILSRYGALSSADIETKSGPNDLVTIADIATEKRLRKGLGEICPESLFVGEEDVARHPDAINNLAESKPVWVIDPLDGTRNFVRGIDEFGTIVALVNRGIVEHGWIYGAASDQMVSVSRSEGFFAEFGGQRIGRQNAGYRAIGSLSEVRQIELLQRLKQNFETTPVHCTAYAYLDILSGKRSFGIFARCHPWDHAAGALMVREAGGVVRYLDDDSEYHPAPTDGRPLLVAQCESDWQKIKEIVWR